MSLMDEEPRTLGDQEQFVFFLKAQTLIEEILGNVNFDFDSLQPEERSGWFAAFELGRESTHEAVNTGAEISIAEKAEHMHNQFVCTNSIGDQTKWPDITPVEQLRWKWLFRAILVSIEWSSDENSITNMARDIAERFREEWALLNPPPEGNTT